LVSDFCNSSNLTPKNSDSLEIKNKSAKRIENPYRRRCKFQIIKINNNRKGLKSAFKKSKSFHFFNVYYPDIDFQTKIFDEQYKLFKENLKEYKNIINKSNYLNVFKSIPLSSKIKYNISIEEICSILYFFPKILLGDYYNLMLRLIDIEIPNHNLFKKKFILNEIDNLSYNNKLLFIIFNYFDKSFEFYKEISKKEEIKNNYLKEKEYFEVMNYFSKSRNNILYLINLFNNSEKNYIKDLLTINQIIKDKKEIYNDANDDISKEIIDNIKEEENKINMKKNCDIIDKIEQQFIFGRNPENGTKNRIDSALGTLKEESPKFDHLGNIRKEKKIKFKSIFNNKYFNTILLHCNQDTKNKILTQKINNEINIAKAKKGYQALKINFC
jgi:hypothetical protein